MQHNVSFVCLVLSQVVEEESDVFVDVEGDGEEEKKGEVRLGGCFD